MDREKERAGVRPACKIEAKLRGTGVTRSCRFESDAEFDRINRSMLIVSRNIFFSFCIPCINTIFESIDFLFCLEKKKIRQIEKGENSSTRI